MDKVKLKQLIQEKTKGLSAIQTQQVLQKVLQIHYRRNLFDFARDVLGYVDIVETTHGQICDALQAETKRKLICVPRGCFKSTITSISYPIWLLANNPNLRIMIDSEVYNNSKNFLREIKGHLASDRFKAIFGDWKGEVWNEGEIIVAPRTKVMKEASIVISGVETTRVGMHFDVIIHDDLCSEANTMSEEMRSKVITHYRMNTAILEPHGSMITVGTRYHDDDIIGHIIKTELDEETVKGLKLA